MRINWGKALIIFFILFFIWVFSFVFFAMRQQNDLVSDDYYQKGANYSDQITINQRSVAYQDSLQIVPAGNNLQLILCKSLASQHDSIKIYFFRSSDKSKDLRFSFKKAESPILITKASLSHGRYRIFVSWNYLDEKYLVQKIVDIE